jgi:hypothetical protein
MNKIHDHLPDTITYRGKEYIRHITVEHNLQRELDRLKIQGYLTRVVKVLAKNLRGKD